MALSKKGLRKIVVDGKKYAWKVRRQPTYSQGLAWGALTFAVEKQESKDSKLIVTTDLARPDNWVLAPSIIVTPALVADSIRVAIKQGWLSNQSTRTFSLQMSSKDKES